jgi:hypothetical protein
MARAGRWIVNLVRGFICTATYSRLPVGQALGLRRPPRPPGAGGPGARRSAGRCPTLLSNTLAGFLKPRT